MPTSRDQLIADWRQRLAETDAADEPHPSRAAWLTRLKHRLYHFLLSLYGTGEWNEATHAPSAEGPDQRLPPPMVEFPRTPQGRKDLGTMRQVLEAVSSAQNNRPAQGPLTSDFIRQTWRVVATASQGLDLDKCQEALRAKGINARLVKQSNEVVVKVSAIHWHRASAFIELQRSQLLSAEMQQAMAMREATVSARIAVAANIVDSISQSLVILALAALAAAVLAWATVEHKLGNLLPRAWYAQLLRLLDANPQTLYIGGCFSLFAMIIFLLVLRHRCVRKRD